MDRRRLWKRIRRIWVTLGILFTVVFVSWSLIAYRASPMARLAIESDSLVAVTHADGVWSFVPRLPADEHSPALVFIPGALVEPIAYAPLAHAAADAGFPAYLVELPRRGAFGGAESSAIVARIDKLFTGSGNRRDWVVAGHSRGAVAASEIAAARRAGFVGLIVIGSSHPRDIDLSGLSVHVTKIVGTRDGLASRAEVEANRSKLPASTRWVWIEGGNHSQFGWYGFQPGDKRARISGETQRQLMTQAVIDALRSSAGSRRAD